MRWWGLLALAGCLPDLGDQSAAAHADRCASCHPVAAEELSASRHSRPAESFLFQTLRDRAGDRAAFCDRCHLPDGLDCLTCHAASGNLSTANGALIADPTGPVRGPFGDTISAHASSPGAFLTDSALCGTCHDVDGLAGFEEHPYQSWLDSPAAADGVRCQDCHMSDTPGRATPRLEAPIAEDGPPRPRSSHAFVGLQEAPVALMAAGVELVSVEGGVSLANLAGHRLPDGASFTRELWLESRDQTGWTGDVRPLHPELQSGGIATWDPLASDTTVFRGLEPGESRFEPFDTARFEVCLRLRPVAAGLSEGLGLPATATQTVVCARD